MFGTKGFLLTGITIILALLAGCSANESRLVGTEPTPAANDGNPYSIAFPKSATEYIASAGPACYGRDFSTEFPSCGVEPVHQDGRFDVYEASGPVANRISFAVYVLNMAEYDPAADLHFVWDPEDIHPVFEGKVWAGISNFIDQRWDWFDVTHQEPLELDFGSYISEHDQLLVTVASYWREDMLHLSQIAVDTGRPAWVGDVVAPGELYGYEGRSLKLNCSYSGEYPITFDWDFGDGAMVNSDEHSSPVITFGPQGVYDYSVTVDNGHGLPYEYVEQLVSVAPTEVWTRTWQAPPYSTVEEDGYYLTDSIVTDSVMGPEGTVFAVGRINTPAEALGFEHDNRDMLFCSVRPDGELLEYRSIGTAESDHATCICRDRSGNLWIGGEGVYDGEYVGSINRVTSQGDLILSAVIQQSETEPNPMVDRLRVCGVYPTTDGGLTVLATMQDIDEASAQYSVGLIKLNADYTVAWAIAHEFPVDLYKCYLEVMPGGDLLVLAATQWGNGIEVEDMYYLLARVGPDGEQRWAKHLGWYRAPGLFTDDIAAVGDNRFYVTLNGHLAAYDGQGNLHWQSQLSTGQHITARCIAIADDGSPVTGGLARGFGGIVAGWSNFGDLEWCQAWNSQTEDEEVTGLGLLPDGSVVAIGRTNRAYGVWQSLEPSIISYERTSTPVNIDWEPVDIEFQEWDWHSVPLEPVLDQDTGWFYHGTSKVFGSRFNPPT